MRIIVSLLLCVCFCISTTIAEEQVKSPAVVVSSKVDPVAKTRTDQALIVASVLVEEVDVDNRLLTIKDSKGKIDTVRVSAAVKRLNELKKGDTITVRYFQSTAFELREPTEEEKKTPGVLFGAAGKADAENPPAAGVILKAHAITTIEEIDKEAMMVRLKGPKGRIVSVQARSRENMAKLNVGDTVAVTMTEALAIGIE